MSFWGGILHFMGIKVDSFIECKVALSNLKVAYSSHQTSEHKYVFYQVQRQVWACCFLSSNNPLLSIAWLLSPWEES